MPLASRSAPDVVGIIALLCRRGARRPQATAPEAVWPTGAAHAAAHVSRQPRCNRRKPLAVSRLDRRVAGASRLTAAHASQGCAGFGCYGCSLDGLRPENGLGALHRFGPVDPGSLDRPLNRTIENQRAVSEQIIEQRAEVMIIRATQHAYPDFIVTG